jgi:beta-xylosidase
VGTPTIAVLSIGGPYALASVIDKLPAVVAAYYAGPHHGTAIADAIFGITNPGGKLPFTMPRHVGQVPIHYAQKWGSGYRRTRRTSTRAISTCRPRRCSGSATV